MAAPTGARRGRPPVNAGAPRGREEVEAALIAAGSKLFAEQNPASVSVRDLATEAGVNHGLVHRYFGSKDGLLSAVLDRLAVDVAREVAAGGDRPNDPATPNDLARRSATDRYWRVLARAMLDGHDPSNLQHDYPTVRLLVEWGTHDLELSADEARVRAAQILALQLGWRMFEPFLRAAAGLERTSSAALAASLDAGTMRLAGAASLDEHDDSPAPS